MAFISLVALLFIEQLLPLNQQRWVRAPLYRVADFVELHTNAGERWHAVAAWMVVVVGAVAIVTGVHIGLRTFSPLLGGVWTLIVLYLTLGFREVGHNFYEIQTALRASTTLGVPGVLWLSFTNLRLEQAQGAGGAGALLTFQIDFTARI